MNMEDNMDNKQGSSMLLGFVAGGLIGSIVALLLAPAKGSETRDMIKQRMQQSKDKMQDTAHKASDKLSEAKDSAKERVSEATQKLPGRRSSESTPAV